MPEPTTDDSFTYEGDIQPLTRKYFNIAGGISGPAAMSFLSERKEKLQTESAKTLELQARSVAFEDAKLKMEENRRKSLQERENMGALSDLQNTLNFGLTQISEEEQPKFFARTSIQFGNLIGTDERAKSMFGNVLKALPSASKKETSAEKITNNIFDAIDDVEFGADAAGNPINAFKDQGSAGKVQRVITNFGTPEEKQGAVNLTPTEQLDVARKIRERRDAAVLFGGQQEKQQGPRSLYAPQSPP
jgi:hypothetical protein